MKIRIKKKGSIEVDRKTLAEIIKENKPFILATYKNDNMGTELENIEKMEGLALVFDAHEYVMPLHRFVENFKNTYGIYFMIMYQHSEMVGQDTSKFTAILEFDKPITLEKYEKLYEALYETYAGYLEEGRQANSLIFGTSKDKKIFGCADRQRRVLTEELIDRIIENKRSFEDKARIEAIKNKKDNEVIKKINTTINKNVEVLVLKDKRNVNEKNDIKNITTNPEKIKNDPESNKKAIEIEQKDSKTQLEEYKPNKVEEDNSELIVALKSKYNQLLQRVKHADIFIKVATDEEIEANKENFRKLKMNVKKVLNKLEDLGYIVTTEEKENGFIVRGEA